MRLLLASSVLSLGLVLSACSSTSASSTAGPCDALTPPPTSLTNVVGVGKDSAGTVYVVDEPKSGYGYRVFVTRSGRLVREHSSGAGSTGTPDGTSSSFIEFGDVGADPSTMRSIFLTVSGGKATDMALGDGASASDVKGGTPSETLTLVDTSTVSSLPVDNLPRVVWLVSDVSDGNVLVLTLLGDDDQGTDGATLFYGTPSAAHQGAIDKLSQSKSGDVYVTFDLGAGTYDAHLANGALPSPPLDTIDVPGKGSLTITERSSTTLEGLSFVCK